MVVGGSHPGPGAQIVMLSLCSRHCIYTDNALNHNLFYFTFKDLRYTGQSWSFSVIQDTLLVSIWGGSLIYFFLFPSSHISSYSMEKYVKVCTFLLGPPYVNIYICDPAILPLEMYKLVHVHRNHVPICLPQSCLGVAKRWKPLVSIPKWRDT